MSFVMTDLIRFEPSNPEARSCMLRGLRKIRTRARNCCVCGFTRSEPHLTSAEQVLWMCQRCHNQFHRVAREARALLARHPLDRTPIGEAPCAAP